jgi:hypothetical protein
MSLSLAESQALAKIARRLYDYLPGKPHPFADQNISFAGASHSAGLPHLWVGGSKLPAIVRLLESTFESQRSSFCRLMLEIVRRGLTYRNSKGKPITREEIKGLNELIKNVHFKVPELWDRSFLDSLPRARLEENGKEERAVSEAGLLKLKGELLKLGELEAKARGFAFEKFLTELFAHFGLAPRGSFRLVGEQIDGSFQIGPDTYLVEAKWHRRQIGQAELLIFREKVESKSTWSRGLFISYSGFTEDGLKAYAKGRSTNIIGMTGQDLYFILDGRISLLQAISRKVRRTAETGEFYIPVYQLSSDGQSR